jgi:hypothetical protein
MTERRELLAALRNFYAVIDAEAAATEPPRGDTANACTYSGDGFEPQPYELEVDIPFRRYPLTLHFLATRPGPAEIMDAT